MDIIGNYFSGDSCHNNCGFNYIKIRWNIIEEISPERLYQTTQLNLLTTKIDELSQQKIDLLEIKEKLSHPGQAGRDARLKAIINTAGNKETNDKLVDVCVDYIQELNSKKPHEGVLTMLRFQLEQAFLIAVAGHFQVYEKLIEEKLVEKFGAKFIEGEKILSKKMIKKLLKQRKQLGYYDYEE